MRSLLLLLWAAAALGQEIPAHNPSTTPADQAAGAKASLRTMPWRCRTRRVRTESLYRRIRPWEH